MAVELRAINPLSSTANNADYGEILPDWSDLTFSQDLIDPGALTFTYPSLGRNADLLNHGTQLVLTLDGIEPNDARFTVNEASGQRLAESDNISATYACTSNRARAAQLILGPAVGSTATGALDFAYTSASGAQGPRTFGGLMISTLANSMSVTGNTNNQRGGGLTGLSSPRTWLTYPITAFTSSADSSGASWGPTYEFTFKAGDTMQTVIDLLTQNGQAEATMYKKELRLYRPENHGANLTTGANPIVLQTGADFTEASYQETSRDLVNSVLITGGTLTSGNSACVWVKDAASIAANGYREGTYNVSDITDINLLTQIGQKYLALNGVTRFSYTYGVSALYLESNYGRPRPFIDYQAGDSILILDGGSPQAQTQRLRLLSATYPSAQSSAVGLTVNDFFAEQQVKFDRALAKAGF